MYFCFLARAPVCTFHLLLSNNEKTRFNDNFFLRRVLCSNLKRTCRLSFFRKKHSPCNTNLQWRIIWLILGMRKTAREAAELCGVIKLIGQMSWHLKQVTKHFCWRGVWKNVLSRGVIRETVKLTWKHLWPRVYSVFSERCLTGRDFTQKRWDIHIYDPLIMVMIKSTSMNLVNVLVRFNQLLWYFCSFPHIQYRHPASHLPSQEKKISGFENTFFFISSALL